MRAHADRELHAARERGAKAEEALLGRREFLSRTVGAAGLGAAAAALPPARLLDVVSRRLRGPSLPPDQWPIDHVVVLMMENRSFDHYFGWLPRKIAEVSQEETYKDASGAEHRTIHFEDLPGEADHQGCGHPDPGHGWTSGRRQLQGGFMAPGSGNDVFALTYFDEDDLGFIHAAARAYTTYDNYFCSALTSTWPNRYYKWSATAGGRKTNSPPFETLGNQWDTIFDVALRAGLTANYYACDLPFAAVWGPRGVSWTRPAAEYFADCAAGTLPNITFIDPPFRDGGGFDGNSADEHPHGDVRLGQAFMADVARAFVESPCYRRGALFVIYDEWGGFFDHVRPPRVPDERASGDLNEDWGQLGFRTPSVCLSPFTRNTTSHVARVDHGLFAHESILRLIADRWGLGDLNLRHEKARSIADSFDFDDPDLEAPDLPDPERIVSRPCSFGGGDLDQASVATHDGDMDGLADLAERFGFEVYASTPSALFRSPDAVRRAYRAPGA